MFKCNTLIFGTQMAKTKKKLMMINYIESKSFSKRLRLYATSTILFLKIFVGAVLIAFTWFYVSSYLKNK